MCLKLDIKPTHLVVACCDGRFTAAYKRDCDKLYGEGKYMMLRLPGGPMYLRPGPKFEFAMTMIAEINQLVGQVLQLVLMSHECCRYCGEAGLAMESSSFSHEWSHFMDEQTQAVYDAIRCSDYCKSHSFGIESFITYFEPKGPKRIELRGNLGGVFPALHTVPRQPQLEQ